MSEYWEVRSKYYNKLKWVKDKEALDELISFSKIKPYEIVMDAGCGTGVLAQRIVKLGLTEDVYALDKSLAMLCYGKDNKKIKYVIHDLEKPLYTIYVEKIIARMVIHHINKISKVFKNLYKALIPGGVLIIEEGGIIPSNKKKVYDWYVNMMEKKEKRNNFTESELESYFKKAGFRNIKKKIIKRKIHIKNWLKNSGLSKSLQKEIYDMHLNAPKYVKDFYGMEVVRGEIIINSRTLLIKGKV